jgi:hypothetical protein
MKPNRHPVIASESEGPWLIDGMPYDWRIIALHVDLHR